LQAKSWQNNLVSIIAQQIGDKPRRLGERLGWNDDKSRFVAPAWEARPLGLQATSNILHPRSKLLASYFRCLDYPVLNQCGLATGQARQVIALLAALLTRAFLNQQTPLIRIRRSPQSLALLQAVFRPLGQVAPVELSVKRQLVESTLSPANFSGYTIYATCPDPRVLEELHFPLFLLCGAKRSNKAPASPTTSSLD
jgi:hypothetical protein